MSLRRVAAPILLAAAASLAACARPAPVLVGWAAAWQHGHDDRTIHILSVTVDPDGARVGYAVVPDPTRSHAWTWQVERDSGATRDGWCLFREGRLASAVVKEAGAAVGTRDSDSFTTCIVSEDPGSGPMGDFPWAGTLEWRLDRGGRTLRGALLADRFDAFGTDGRRTPGTPCLAALVRTALGALGVSPETAPGAAGDGTSSPGPSPRAECLRFVVRAGTEFREPGARRLTLIARAALRDHSFREAALASADPAERAAGVVSLGLDISVPDRVGAIVSEMIRDPAREVRSACAGQLVALECAHLDSGGLAGASIPETTLLRLAETLREGPVGDDMEPIAGFVGSRGCRDGLEWYLAVLHRADPPAAGDLWWRASALIEGVPADPSDFERERWQRRRIGADDYSWDGDQGRFVLPSCVLTPR